jgi:hypothetical protein
MSEEELAKLEGEIPDWKKGALTTTDIAAEEERPGLLKRAASRVKKSIDNTEAAKQFYQSEEYKKIEQLRSEVNEFRGNLKDEVESS